MPKLYTFNKKKSDFSKICRICLQERNKLRNIFSTRFSIIFKTLFPEVQASEDDLLPDKICMSCSNQVSRFYTFKKKVERSNRILVQYLKQKKKRWCLEKYSDILDKAVATAEIISNCQSECSKDASSGEEEQRETVAKPDHHILLDEPPPLVPLDRSLFGTELITEPKLPDNAPPLVPIKPLATLDPAVIVNALGNSVENSVKLNLQCTLCNEEFNSVYALKNHRLLQCQSNTMQCNICKKQFSDRDRLIGHLKGHMVSKHYCCKMCGKRYPNPSTFRVHMRTHTGERPFKCQICNKGFTRWAGVVEHMKTHNSSKPYKCLTCGKGFKMASNLERHKILHSNSLPFCCSYCGKTFSQSDNLQLHVRTYHTNDRPYLCNICGKCFVSSTRLKRHMWIHSGYKPYRCRHCSKSYSNSNDRNNHEKYHVGLGGSIKKPYSCAKCDMKFVYPCRLAKHLKIHDRPYECDECLKTFRLHSLLVKHLASKHNIVMLQETSTKPIYKLSLK